MAQHRAAGGVFVDEEDLLDSGREDGRDLVEDLLDDWPGLGGPVDDESEASHLLRPRDDGDIVLEEEVEVRLKDLVEPIIIGEQDERTACLGHPARQTKHAETDEFFAVLETRLNILLKIYSELEKLELDYFAKYSACLESHVEVVADTRLSWHVGLL